MHYSYRYYLGRRPRIIITDLDMLKQILVKDFDNFTDHTVSGQAHSVAQPISWNMFISGGTFAPFPPICPPSSSLGLPPPGFVFAHP